MSAPRFCRSDDAVLRVVGDHRVLLPVGRALPADAYLFLLDGPVAEAVWEALAEPLDADALAARVAAEFAVDRATATRDVETFLAQLEQAGFAERV